MRPVAAPALSFEIALLHKRQAGRLFGALVGQLPALVAVQQLQSGRKFGWVDGAAAVADEVLVVQLGLEPPVPLVVGGQDEEARLVLLARRLHRRLAQLLGLRRLLVDVGQLDSASLAQRLEMLLEKGRVVARLPAVRVDLLDLRFEGREELLVRLVLRLHQRHEVEVALHERHRALLRLVVLVREVAHEVQQRHAIALGLDLRPRRQALQRRLNGRRAVLQHEVVHAHVGLGVLPLLELVRLGLLLPVFGVHLVREDGQLVDVVVHQDRAVRHRRLLRRARRWPRRRRRHRTRRPARRRERLARRLGRLRLHRCHGGQVLGPHRHQRLGRGHVRWPLHLVERLAGAAGAVP